MYFDYRIDEQKKEENHLIDNITPVSMENQNNQNSKQTNKPKEIEKPQK